ncbi:hypothetical protein F1721_04490 [Saccharopolyspora hirsuta]|uniref:Uncharacterized protein n=1 Tax=Saccharopolyspora hirsuta TaxID=1837 RepID=A0A5M7CF72_SACHI|nr:hypothetical protein [Saccharopolyspora hirsuta]KAA5837085.1 hypothetical protein F1721_04490 [Saccharopolyspora hirsuta]
MSFHYPFSDIDRSRFAAAGFGLASRSRRLTAQQVLEVWPLAWVPQVRMEIHLAADSDPQASQTEVAVRFTESVATLDGASPFWEEKAFEVEDLGVPTSATHEWLVGRAGLPLA